MKRIVAIIVGHYGVGTGAIYKEIDEFNIALESARVLYETIYRDNYLTPNLFYIDPRELRFKIWGNCLTAGTTLRVKANWVEAVNPDCAIEIHYNAAEKRTKRKTETGGIVIEKTPLITANGHEVICKNRMQLNGGLFADSLFSAMAELPNKPRRIVENEKFLLPRLIDKLGIEFAIVEPAFIYEKVITGAEWDETLAGCLARGIYDFMGVDYG